MTWKPNATTWGTGGSGPTKPAPAPLALTDANARELETAIRREGYEIAADAETGEITLTRRGWDVPDNPWPALERMQAVIRELAEACTEAGVPDQTLDLWSVGKCIGGPEVSIGTSTPLTCMAILDSKKGQGE